MIRFSATVFLLVLFVSSVRASGRVVVYAAASLTHVLEEVAEEAKSDGLDVRISVGSSSTLAKQILRGAPADIYVSANTAWMDYVDGLDLLEPDTRFDLLSNEIVVIAPKDAPFEMSAKRGFDFSAAFGGRLAIGDPDHVPGGIYAKQALQALGWWTGVAGRLAPSVDVRAALALVERGECGAGIVYATDAAVSDRVVVVGVLPKGSHDEIVYPAAVVRGRLSDEVKAVWDLLRSERAERVFVRHGFRIPDRHDRERE